MEEVRAVTNSHSYPVLHREMFEVCVGFVSHVESKWGLDTLRLVSKDFKKIVESDPRWQLVAHSRTTDSSGQRISLPKELVNDRTLIALFSSRSFDTYCSEKKYWISRDLAILVRVLCQLSLPTCGI